MISIENFKNGFEAELWDVYFSAIRTVCINDYSTEQVNAWAPEKFDMKIWSKKIRDINPFVAKLSNEIVGYADVQADGLVDHFFVHGRHQSKGVGTALMNAILRKGASYEKLYSHVSMTAKPFFSHHNFIVVCEKEVEVRGCKMKNNLMERVQHV